MLRSPCSFPTSRLWRWRHEMIGSTFVSSASCSFSRIAYPFEVNRMLIGLEAPARSSYSMGQLATAQWFKCTSRFRSPLRRRLQSAKAVLR